MSKEDFSPSENPFSLFKATWKAFQKVLTPEEAKKILPRVGKELSETFPIDQVIDLDSLKETLKTYLENGLGMVGNVDIEIAENLLSFHNNQCFYCPGNTELRKEGHSPTCIFPPLILSILQQVRNQVPDLGLDNLKFLDSKKPGPVGECVMNFNIH